MSAPADTPPTSTEIEVKIFALLAARRSGATVCPSEVARGLLGEGGEWRALMSPVRAVAAALVKEDRLVVTRGGVNVDATDPGGPIRLGLPPAPGSAG